MSVVGKVALLVGSTLVALLLAEGLTRVFYPVSDGAQNLTLQGDPITGWAVPGTVYRQIGTEYDALTTITDEGHRVPVVRGNPEVVFIGDSFTFGWGLGDDETFASLYCEARELVCANLGLPGTGTARQLDRLEYFLSTHEWRPREVKLVMFAMTAWLSAGNDLADNYAHVYETGHVPGTRLADRPSPGEAVPEHSRPQAHSNVAEPRVGLLERLLAYRYAVLARSNLVRIVKFHWGPLLKALLVPELDEERLAEALAFTEAELDRLVEISQEHDFAFEIYLIHPVQDLSRGTHAETLEKLNGVAPVEIRSTADAFGDRPERLYYPYDGHINALGSEQVVEFLLAADAEGGDQR